jgi:integrase
MGRQHIRDCVVHVTQSKTGVTLAIPIHPALAAIIDATPTNHLTFLVTEYGQPFTPAGFGNWFREQCDAAGLPARCAAHGLHKAACRRLAEAGCSANVIAAVSGHRSLREVERYTRAADQGAHGSDGRRRHHSDRREQKENIWCQTFRKGLTIHVTGAKVVAAVRL